MKSITKYLIGILGQVKATLTRFFRDKTALFFTFIFPLIFLFIFGSIFNKQDLSFKVGIVNHSDTEFARNFLEKAKSATDSPLNITEYPDFAAAEVKLKRSELSAIIELPANFGALAGTPPLPSGELELKYSKGSDQVGSTIAAILDQIISDINSSLGHPAPPLKVAPMALGDAALSNFDYTFTGLLSFSLISMAIFGLSNALPADKQKGIYHRLRASSLTKSQLILSVGISYVIITLVSLTTMVITGLIFFKFNMRGSWFDFAAFITVSSVMMVGIGLFIGGWAKNENQAPALANIVAMPMMFLSGTFIPVFFFPEWLQSISRFIPVTPIVDGTRMIMTEAASLSAVAPQLILIFVWTSIIYALAIKFFRWD